MYVFFFHFHSKISSEEPGAKNEQIHLRIHFSETSVFCRTLKLSNYLKQVFYCTCEQDFDSFKFSFIDGVKG